MPAGSDINLINAEVMDYLRLLFVLAGVLVLAWAAVRYLLPKITGVRQFTSGPMRVVARLGLEPRKNLYIVKAGSGYYLIGTSEGDVHFLTSLDPEDIPDAPEKKPGTEKEFGRLLRGFRNSGER